MSASTVGAGLRVQMAYQKKQVTTQVIQNSNTMEKTAVQRAVEKAVQGGWDWYGHVANDGYTAEDIYNDHDFNIYKELLNIEFWKAIGKAEGWGDATTSRYPTTSWQEEEMIPIWHFYMIKMIDALASEQSIEAYLNEIV